MTEVQNIEAENPPFEDSDLLLELRSMITELLVTFSEAKTTGNSGCGCGSADAEFELHGVTFTVSISLSGDDDVEH